MYNKYMFHMNNEALHEKLEFKQLVQNILSSIYILEVRSNKHSTVVIYSHYSNVQNACNCAIKVLEKISLHFISIIINHWCALF